MSVVRHCGIDFVLEAGEWRPDLGRPSEQEVSLAKALRVMGFGGTRTAEELRAAARHVIGTGSKIFAKPHYYYDRGERAELLLAAVTSFFHDLEWKLFRSMFADALLARDEGGPP